jgi:RimJ/RimL family protein N-acetyltransferase
MRPPAEFETARLRLRAPRIEDADAIFREYAADSEVTRYMIWVPHQSVDSVCESLKTTLQRWEDGTEFSWVIEEQTGSGANGMISASVRKHKVGIGYALARRCWNRGYMIEVVSAVCDIENIGPTLRREADCEAILRSFPQ